MIDRKIISKNQDLFQLPASICYWNTSSYRSVHATNPHNCRRNAYTSSLCSSGLYVLANVYSSVYVHTYVYIHISVDQYGTSYA